MRADIVIENGRLIDPCAGLDGVMSVAIAGGRILRIGDCSEITAEHKLDAKGCIVTPGLVDSHMHIFEGSGYGSVRPDPVMLPSGVTAGFDAGSAGVLNFRAFSRLIIRDSISTVRALLNLSPAGLCMSRCHPERVDPRFFDRAAIAECIAEHPGEIIGLKLRISREIAGELGLEPLRAAVEIAGELGLALVIHSTNPPESTAAVLNILRPGDVFGHCFHGVGSTIIGLDGHVDECVLAARKRGIIFDAANGAEHFSWKTARAAMSDGFYPDSISTDMCRPGQYMGFMHSLPFLMSKYLCAGMPLERIIEAVTSRPAAVFGQLDSMGTMREGASADVAVFRIAEGRRMSFPDRSGDCESGDRAFIPQLTVKRGRIYYRQVDF